MVRYFTSICAWVRLGIWPKPAFGDFSPAFYLKLIIYIRKQHCSLRFNKSVQKSSLVPVFIKKMWILSCLAVFTFQSCSSFFNDNSWNFNQITKMCEKPSRVCLTPFQFPETLSILLFRFQTYSGQFANSFVEIRKISELNIIHTDKWLTVMRKTKVDLNASTCT